MAQYISKSHLKTAKVALGLQYSYVFHRAQGTNATFLLLHGFPSSAYDWRHQFDHLTTAGYGVLIPDLLGYGGTDKPLSVEQYAYANQSEHLVDILKEEGLDTVIGVGHDWGAILLARFLNYHPDRFSAATFLSCPYRGPEPIDLDFLDQLMTQFYGYPTFGYWRFFKTDEAAAIIKRKHDSFISIVYSSDYELQKTHFCPPGKLEEWLQGGEIRPRPVWLSEEEQATHSEVMIEGGYEAPFNWYKSAIANTDVPNWSQIPPEHLIVRQPVVFINGQLDPVTRPEAASVAAEEGQKKGFLLDVQVKYLDAGHWLQLQKKQEVSDILVELAQRLPH